MKYPLMILRPALVLAAWASPRLPRASRTANGSGRALRGNAEATRSWQRTTSGWRVAVEQDPGERHKKPGRAARLGLCGAVPRMSG